MNTYVDDAALAEAIRNTSLGTTEIMAAIKSAGWVKPEPVFEETLTNDGTHELTISSDCDGSNVVYWKRTPRLVAETPPSPWFAIGEGQA
ncbi:hypothetical protein ASF74_14840 [Arthrobacter sp. Leaf145]|nr:hypothetical protein ASF74_14840 [Arthrobacter sp. Leaf145]